MLLVPGSALVYGFMNNPVGTHGSRTIMLSELRLLLAACPVSSSHDDYRQAILDRNVLLKQTDSTRRESFRRLRELYGLDSGLWLFRSLRDLWDSDAAAQPLLSLLCAAARDPILRATADPILSLAPGTEITPHMIAAAADQGLPGRYNSMMLANIGRHAASSWQQSGHLSGRAHKVRSVARPSPASVAYALLLGHLCEARGDTLFSTFWARLLDASDSALRSFAIAASSHGWLEYKHSGGVTEVGFRYLFREQGQDGLL